MSNARYAELGKEPFQLVSDVAGGAPPSMLYIPVKGALVRFPMKVTTSPSRPVKVSEILSAVTVPVKPEKSVDRNNSNRRHAVPEAV